VATNAVNQYLQTKQNEANVELTNANTAKVQAETSVIKDTNNSLIGRNVEYAKKELQKLGSHLFSNTAEGFKEFKEYMDKNYKGKFGNLSGNTNDKTIRIPIPLKNENK
jgi:predicted transcriptional regulator